MVETREDAKRAVAAAALRVRDVRTVPMVRFGREDGTNRVLVVVRIGLPPNLTLQGVVNAIAHVQLAAARVLERGAAVSVEPDVAVDAATPTDAITIRGLE